MRQMDIGEFDLNLLLRFECLLVERSVQGAAFRAGISQPAMSRSLARLRQVFDDPLFLRGGRGLIPTSKAERLAPVLERVLGEMRAALVNDDVPLRDLERRFRLWMHDYMGGLVMPNLFRWLSQRAPNVVVEVVHRPADPLRALSDGKLDLAIGALPTEDKGIKQEVLFSDRFVSIVRENHPILGETMTPERFARLRHAAISVTRNPSFRPIDGALKKQGLSRRIVVWADDFLTLPHLIAESDLVLTLPRSVARLHGRTLALQTFEPPIDLPLIQIHQTWHSRTQNDRWHIWLRDAVRRAASTAVVS